MHVRGVLPIQSFAQGLDGRCGKGRLEAQQKAAKTRTFDRSQLLGVHFFFFGLLSGVVRFDSVGVHAMQRLHDHLHEVVAGVGVAQGEFGRLSQRFMTNYAC